MSNTGYFKNFLHLTRFHIIAIAVLACLTFGWLMTGQHLWLPLVFCAVDWFIVNFANRVVDLAEDERNGIAGTELVARHGRLYEAICWALMVLSLLVGHWLAPAATPWRIAFSIIGVLYNYRWIPMPGRRTRFKEMYFFKNFMSAVLFLISTIAYPLVIGGASPSAAWLVAIVGFFLPLEITYEIIYDLRDVAGDQQENVPTYPVVHGVAASHTIIYVLLAASALALVAGGVAGVLKMKELGLIGGVLQQFLYFQFKLRDEPTAARCILVTYLGAAQIASYHVWIAAGLPTEWPL
ncbi:MAG: UbiA family prenyltransferase [Deltaproteobacteria bacterium]|nr:UbiA family prenyltransferase [Deltaproteobacteria bacterium]